MADTDIIKNFKSTETDVVYTYEVRLIAGCELFKYQPFNRMKKLGEFSISSIKFKNYSECVQDCVDILNEFARRLQRITKERYVIATKINPLHNPDTDPDAVPSEEWDENTVLRMYLSEMDLLKKEGKMKWCISATLSVKPNVDLRRADCNAIKQ